MKNVPHGEKISTKEEFDQHRVRMRGAIVATLILLSTGHVEGVGRDHWRSDHVHLEGGHQQGGGDGHQHPGLGENIDLRARARAAHRSGKCELLVSNAPPVVGNS